jgi:hypothetical protein
VRRSVGGCGTRASGLSSMPFCGLALAEKAFVDCTDSDGSCCSDESEERFTRDGLDGAVAAAAVGIACVLAAWLWPGTGSRLLTAAPGLDDASLVNCLSVCVCVSVCVRLRLRLRMHASMYVCEAKPKRACEARLAIRPIGSAAPRAASACVNTCACVSSSCNGRRDHRCCLLTSKKIIHVTEGIMHIYTRTP